MNLVIRKAERKQRKFKACLVGVSGSGKTWTALELATGLVKASNNSSKNSLILLLDSENHSSSLYADSFNFDIGDLPPGASVKDYLEGIRVAEKNGYEVLIIDSLSHAWEYLLEEVDRVQTRKKTSNSFTAWKDVTPIYKELIKAIVNAKINIITTMRAKSAYVMQEYEGKDGKTKSRPQKVGVGAIFRQGGEYEFDLVADIDLDHNFITDKTRINFLADAVINKPDRELGIKIGNWYNSGAKEEAPEPEKDPGTYKLECAQSKLRGKTLKEIQEKNPEWLAEAMKDEKRKALLTDRDVVNINKLLNLKEK